MRDGTRGALTILPSIALALLITSAAWAQTRADVTPGTAASAAAAAASGTAGSGTAAASGVAAESEKRPAPGSAEEALQKRVAQLEAEMELMREEMRLLKQSSSLTTNSAAANAATGPTPTTGSTASTAVSATAAVASPAAITPAAPAGATANTQSKPEEEHRPGVQIGPVRVIPYALLHVSLFGNSGGTNNADVPLFATPTGVGNTSATARESRLGLRFEGPEIAGAKSSGVFETDFTGGFPAIGIGEDFGVVRLRLAYFKLDWKNTTLQVGQDWTIFSPGNPVSLASVGTPEFAAGGNLFARIPQIRLEQRWLDGKISWAGAVLASTTGDYPAPNTNPFVLQPGGGAASRIPAFESRLAVNGKDWLGANRAGTIGISVHYGRERVIGSPHNTDIDVMGVSADWDMPLVKRLTFAGEAFFGRNLGGFAGDVSQTFTPDFAYKAGNVLVPGGPRAPGTRGGWTQLGFTPPILGDRFTIFESFGIEDPRDKDFISLSKREARLRNLAFASCLRYKFSPQLSWGLEYRRLETQYLFAGRQNNNHLNLAAAYTF